MVRSIRDVESAETDSMILLPHGAAASPTRRRQRGNATMSCTANVAGIEPLCSTKKVMLLHFSKCSGTALCSLARKVGCSTWDQKRHPNCARRTRDYQDGPWWIPRTHATSDWQRANFAYEDDPARVGRGRKSCAARLKGAPAFHEVESALPGGRACAGFFSIALVRPPLERLVSHSWELALWGMVVPAKQGYCRNYTHMRALAPAVYDNYYTRMLLGEQGMVVPLGALTRAHLAHARSALSTLDLILETNEPRTPLALQYSTGIANFTSCRAPRAAPICAMSAEDLARAARDNALDLEVYAYARNLSEGHLAKLFSRAEGFVEGRAA